MSTPIKLLQQLFSANVAHYYAHERLGDEYFPRSKAAAYRTEQELLRATEALVALSREQRVEVARLMEGRATNRTS